MTFESRRSKWGKQKARTWGLWTPKIKGESDKSVAHGVPGACRVVLRRVPDERMGAGPDTEGEAREGVDTPAATDMADALSMYFSMRRSLFQFM